MLTICKTTGCLSSHGCRGPRLFSLAAPLTLLPLTTSIRVVARRWHCWAIWSYQHTAHNLPCCNKKILHQHLLNMHTTVHIILNVWCCAYEKKRNMGQISFCVTFVSLSFLLFCSPFVFFIYIEHDSSPFFYEFSVFEKKNQFHL